MRSSLLAIALVCACGNLSNEDVAFVEAIPSKEQLQVQVPLANTAQPACQFGNADVYTTAKTTGDSINAGVNSLLTLVDAIRGVAPTTRSSDSRTWGPFPDSNHPGFTVRVDMERELDAQGVPWRWDYQITETKADKSQSLVVLEGNFYGPMAKDGTGRIVLHFENSQALGIAGAKDPGFPLNIYYELGTDPHRISLDLTEGVGFGVPSFDYQFAGYADGHGSFAFAAAGSNGCTQEINTAFTAKGAGRDTVNVKCGPFNLGTVQQCWDVSNCLSYINDPLAITLACGGLKPCLLGSAASCPQ
jgi:hypothetical protein